MSTIRLPDPVKFISSIFSSEKDVLAAAVRRLSEEFGSIDYISELFAFDYTGYYKEEMGEPLLRRFISFDELIDPGDLSRAKIFTNSIENQTISDGKRRVNIDPGYISEAHLILATGKKYTHRPYIGNGVYADVTLIYRDHTFQTLEWTYPDYAGKTIIEMLIRMRKKYLVKLAEFRAAGRRIQ